MGTTAFNLPRRPSETDHERKTAQQIAREQAEAMFAPPMRETPIPETRKGGDDERKE